MHLDFIQDYMKCKSESQMTWNPFSNVVHKEDQSQSEGGFNFIHGKVTKHVNIYFFLAAEYLSLCTIV